MSSPITNTVGSVRISWAMASAMARAMVSLRSLVWVLIRASSRLNVSNEYLFQGGFRRRVGTVPGEADGGVHPLAGGLHQALVFRLGQGAFAEQQGAEGGN